MSEALRPYAAHRDSGAPSTAQTEFLGETPFVSPYPAYKDSGVPWLGEVPAHWEILPNRALFAEIIEKGHPDEQMLSVTIGRGVIQQSNLLENSPKKDSSNENKSNYKLVMPGDIAYNKMRAWQGAIGVSEYQGIVSPAYVIVRPCRKHDSRYFHYLYRTPPFAKEAERWSYGITSDQWSLRPEHFKQIYSCLPPPSEQGAIVRYLDYVDARIRRYVRAKRRLIELLTEQKQALIHQAVTGRVDVRTGEPYAAYKPSGVEWLGDVPAHWEVLRLKYLFKEIDERSQEGLETLLSLRMYQGLVPHNEVSTIPIGPTNLIGYKVVRPGNLVMNRMRAALGMFGVAYQTGIVSPDYAIFRTIRAIETDYYLNLFKTNVMRGAFRTESKGLGTGASGFLRLYSDRFGQIQVPLPPTTDQLAILAHIANVTRQLAQTIDRTQAEIDLVREYRTRLIADVVTGKLDVREAAARLPAAEEEQEAIEDTELEDEASVPEGSVAEDFEIIDDEVLAEDG